MNALMHVTDWFPTLCAIAGVDYDSADIQTLDGLNQINNILNGEADIYVPRTQILHNILSNGCTSQICGALRYRNYKIIGGQEAEAKVWDCQSIWCPPVDFVDDSKDASMTVQCTESGNFHFPIVDFALDCPYNGYPCLFDIDSDPCEYADLRESEPDIYEFMFNLLMEYNATQRMPTLYSLYSADNTSDPDQFGGFWSSWKDEEVLSKDMMEANLVAEQIIIEKQAHSSRWFGRAAVLTLSNVMLIMAVLVIKVLYDWWSGRRSYKEISDSNEVV